MQLDWNVIYLLIFLQTLVFSLVLTPIAGKLGVKFGLIDRPGAKKIHTIPRPRSGGIAIFLSFFLVLVIDVFLALLIQSEQILAPGVVKFIPNIKFVSHQLLGLLLGGIIIFLTGVLDDSITLRPTQKLFLQIVATVPLLISGIQVVLFLPPILGIILTILWLVLIMNAFNFIDNMDGLCSGVAFIVLVVLAFISYQSGEHFMVALYVALAGATLGFWRYNFYRARLFMGDSGSLFIGYMLGALTIMATYYQADRMPTKLPVLMPVIVLGVPIFDTVSVVLIRIHQHRPIMQGDTNHFSHRLVQLGLKPWQAVIFIYLVTICVALNALPLRYLNTAESVVHFLQTLLLFIIIYLLELAGKIKQNNLNQREN